MASEDEDVPESGAVFTFGKSRFLDNKFWIRNDVIIHVACGDEHSAVVTEIGKLYTFGSNDWGQLGQGNTVQLPSPKVVKRLKPEKVKLVAAGRNHTIVSTESGKLYSFGCGSDGQLGHGDCENSTEPKVIGSLPDRQYKALSCGSDFSAAVTAGGQLYTWGSSSEGQTGHGNEDCETPTQLHLKEKVVTVACGYYHMAVVTDDGSLYSCGENEGGKLGLDDSQLPNTSKLQKLCDINERVVTVACGGNHTAAVTESGKLYTFGQGDHGQLGLGSSHLQSSSPKQVTSLRNIHVVGAACGESHTAIITKHGKLFTCGDGRHGKLGMGEESFSNLFRLERVTRFDDFVVQEVACGGCHTLVTAIRKTGLREGSDSEAETEKDILSASISSTKSLLDAIDGPQLYKGGLASTLPAGGTARNKRRQRNIENLGNSFGGSLPPVSKSSLPPLSGFGVRTLPTLNKLPSKEEKLPVNPLNMSTLPKISHDDQDKNDKKRRSGDDNLSASKGSEKITKQETTLKDAESSSGISESEEEDEEGDNGQIKKVKKEVYKKEELKQDTDTAHEEDVSEESMTQDESDSEEDVSADVKAKHNITAAVTSKAVQEGDKTSKDHRKTLPAKEKEESSEEEEDSEEEEESAEEGTRSEKKEQLKVIGQKIKIKEDGERKEAGSNDDVDDEESEDDEDDDDDDDDNNENVKNKKEKDIKTPSKTPGKEEINEKSKTKKTKKGVKKDQVKKKESKKEETDEEEEEDEDESQAGIEDKKGKTSSKGKDKLKDKKSKDKRTKDKGGESEDTVEKKIVDAKDKKNAKKGKEKDDKEDERDEDAKNNEAEDEEHDENKNKSEKSTQNKIGKNKDGAVATKTKEKKSGICVLL